MPTVHKQITDTNQVDVIVPPKHRKAVIRFVRIFNAGTSDATLTLQQVSPDGSMSRVVDEVKVSAGQTEIITDTMIYDLDRGFKLQGKLDVAGDVRITVTYELK